MLINSPAYPLVQLYILSRDRPHFCKVAVQSAVEQSYSNFEIIVSDNSESDDVFELLKDEYSNVRLIRRKPTLKGFDHFNILIKESSAPLIVLFHDDDILERDYVSSMVSIMQNNPHVAAAACNARVIYNYELSDQKVMGSFKGFNLLSRPVDLIKQYFSFSLSGPAPLPGYMYRTSLIKDITFDKSKGGKHADVSFLADILKKNKILWTSDCLFRIRLHSNNWSVIESIADRLSLIRFFYASFGVSPKSKMVVDYKFSFWLNWLKRNNMLAIPVTLKINKGWRQNIVSKFVFLWIVKASITRFVFWHKLILFLHKKLSRHFS